VQSVAEKEVEERGWEDTSCRFQVDHLLRQNGWKIVERKKGQEALWGKEDSIYPFSEAVRFLKRRELKDAQYAEELYSYGME
jgi:malate/lactate dehydrogenase